MIEMPNPTPELLIFEPFVETDEIIVSSSKAKQQLSWKGTRRWVEITVGVIGKRGSMHSLSPSLTVKESGDILSLEEKFQGRLSLPLHVVLLYVCESIISLLQWEYVIISFNRRHWHKPYPTSTNNHEVQNSTFVSSVFCGIVRRYIR